jgi:hypothetical protein
MCGAATLAGDLTLLLRRHRRESASFLALPYVQHADLLISARLAKQSFAHPYIKDGASIA